MGIPNLQHSDKWTINFSNLPGYKPNASNTDNIQMFELYIKEFTLPEIGLDLVKSRFMNYQINHQISQINDNLSDLSIVFKVSEGMKNYIFAYEYIKHMREEHNVMNAELFRLNFIKSLVLTLLDNEKRDVMKYRFSNCFITNLSSLTLTQGVDQEMTFTLSLVYEDFTSEVIEC